MSGYIWTRKEIEMKLEPQTPINHYLNPDPNFRAIRAEYRQMSPENANLFVEVRLLANLSETLRRRFEKIYSELTGEGFESQSDIVTGPAYDGAFPKALRDVQHVRDDLFVMERLVTRLEALLPKE